ncbi:MAG TPA: Gfo/Idh/MocA family oxidoreductase [Solirubrobacteraceae bacterium]|jgi:predicted dehydrogenase
MGLRWGLLSTAKINGAILGGAALTDAAEVVAVASRDAARAEAYAAEHGIARAHGSYEALLADPEVDAIYNPLPNSLHVEWSVKALQAGKHVLCEKPLTRRAADAEAAFDAAERADRVLMEAFMWRFLPQTARLRALLDEGAIGRVRAIRSSFSFPLARPDDIRFDPALDGGALMDVGTYCVSGSRLVAGAEPVAVEGVQVLGGKGVDIAFAGTLRFPDDVLAQFDCGFAHAQRHDLEAVGEDGTLHLADPWHGREPVIVLRQGDEVSRIECEQADPYALELEAFAAGAPLLGREDAVSQARVIEALYASAEGKA